jgi:ring-1,2-phenylacetyl-CoA epoxidase subunit PaaB
MKKRSEYEVYEVFVRKAHGDPHQHVGSLLASSPDLALLMARENFLRRDHADSIWVVPRRQVKSAEDASFLGREMDRKYREVAGYTENGRLWRMFKGKALTLEEIIAYVEEQKQKGTGEKGKVQREGAG